MMPGMEGHDSNCSTSRLMGIAPVGLPHAENSNSPNLKLTLHGHATPWRLLAQPPWKSLLHGKATLTQGFPPTFEAQKPRSKRQQEPRIVPPAKKSACSASCRQIGIPVTPT